MKHVLLSSLFIIICSFSSAQTPSIAEARRLGASPHLLTRADALGLPDMSFDKAVMLDSNRILIQRFSRGQQVMDTLEIPPMVPRKREALDSLLHEHYGGYHPLLNDSPLLQGFGLISEIPWPLGLICVCLALWWRKQ